MPMSLGVSSLRPLRQQRSEWVYSQKIHLCACRSLTCSPSKVHVLIRSSQPPLASREPSGDQHTVVTRRLDPLKQVSCVPNITGCQAREQAACPLVPDHFTSTVAFATAEVKRPDEQAIGSMPLSPGRFTWTVANATAEVKPPPVTADFTSTVIHVTVNKDHLCPCPGPAGFDFLSDPQLSNSQVQSLLCLLSWFQSNKTYASGRDIYALCPLRGLDVTSTRYAFNGVFGQIPTPALTHPYLLNAPGILTCDPQTS